MPNRIVHFFVTLPLAYSFFYLYATHLSNKYLLILAPYLAILVAYFSYIPDIDLRYYRKAKEYFRRTSFIKKIIYFPKTILYWLVLKVFKHRTFTHSLLFILLLLLLHIIVQHIFPPLSILTLVLLLAVSFHILEDITLSGDGTYLLWPFLSKKIGGTGLVKVHTSIRSIVISVLSLLLFIYLLLVTNYFDILKLFIEYEVENYLPNI